MKRLFLIALLLTPLASGYYHYVHYNSRTGPYFPIREKYDLTALYNKTLPFFIADLGPTQYVAQDNFPALVSQIRAAASAWNNVDSSDLRLAYGGLYSQGTPENTPGIDVIFSDDIPPGLVALTVNSTKQNPDLSAGFVPIAHSTVMFPKDLTSRPAFSEAFFLTAVHELGHALGLQHTMTSSALSTEVTRGTSKSKPLTIDDIAGISILYPTKSFLASSSTVSGRVTMNGAGMPMASVVLLTPSGPIISALTHPDGTYTIEGVPTGQYYLYVHPLPPALTPGETSPANIIAPKGPDGQSLPFGQAFDLAFYPGTSDVNQAFPISVTSGSSQSGLNFSVTPRSRQTLYAVQTFGFPGDTPVKPPFLSVDIIRPYIVAAGYGLVSNGAPTPGLKASVIGGSAAVASDGIKSYPYSSAYVQMGVSFNPLAGNGPRHLLFSLNGENYVLPTAFQVVVNDPPSITSIANGTDAAGNRIATVTGTSFTTTTRFLFDGHLVLAKSIDVPNQRAVLAVPPGAPGSKSIVTAYNDDGQSSLFLQTSNPPTYQYDSGASGDFSLLSSNLPAGVTTMIEVDGSNTNFVDGQVTVGFGNSDVTVQRVWAVSPTKLLANVLVSPNATPGSMLASVTNGLQVISHPFAFQVLPSTGSQPVQLNPVVINAASGAANLVPGAVAVATILNSTNTSAPTVTLNDKPVSVVAYQPGQVSFQIPSNQPLGYAVLKVQIGSDTALPIVINIDPPPPTVVQVTALPNVTIDQNRPASPGDILVVTLTGLPDNIVGGLIVITINGTDYIAQQVAPNQFQFVFSQPNSTGSTNVMTVSIDGRASSPYILPVSASN